MESLPNDFLTSLDDDFNKYRPDRESSHNNYNDRLAPITSWHDVMRDQSKKPEIPPSEFIIPRSSTVPMMKIVSSHGMVRTDSVISQLEHRQKKMRQQLENKETVNMTVLCKQGWTLAKGWQNRPQGTQIDPADVHHNIHHFASRLRKGSKFSAAKNVMLDNYSPNTFRVNHIDEISTFKPPSIAVSKLQKTCAYDMDNPMIDVKAVAADLKRSSSPGPKYNLCERPSTAEGAQDDHRHHTYTTAKNITFGSTARFPEGCTQQYLDAINPQNNTICLNTKGYPKLYSAGREFFGSIYCDGYSAVSPGPKYVLDHSYRRQSTVTPCLGTMFSTHNREFKSNTKQHKHVIRDVENSVNPSSKN